MLQGASPEYVLSFFLFFLGGLNILFSAEQPALSPERQNAGAHHEYVFCFNTVIIFFLTLFVV